MSYVLILLSYLLLMVGMLISVAFIILVERKVLGYIQLRKGPNKVGLIGILQSFSDAIKLFIKEQMFPSNSNMVPFYFAPLASFFIILLMWILIPTYSNTVNMALGGLMLFCCTSFGVYTLMGSGWSSNSSYALLGAIRGVAQTISYEVALALFFLSSIFLVGFYSIYEFAKNQEYLWMMVFMFPIFLSWLSSSLAETNRTPFDFAEGESELVSGFNVEYGSGGFALLFLAEYSSIIFMSYLMALMFFGGLSNLIMLNIMGVMFCFLFIWVRGTLPRLRYDKLMGLAWKSYLPISLNFLLFYMMVGISSYLLLY
uniref:NADH-ubiquinone oxidoreductase chain 1 n=1 Tax=Gomphiocephalus hodgsoni TaxID=221270 RepID=Q85QQ2_GOMHO|nr:NADH dehydrogenase subunit 1 [Gomphiocephalus hodgsoni]AAO43670.1 NADH dehydrogenase subunit 1 [Gomphiocephalus hodgsoni]